MDYEDMMLQLMQQASKSASLQSGLGQQIFNQVKPLRNRLGSRYLQAVNPAFQQVTTQNVAASPLYGALKSSTSQNYAQARQSVLEDTPGARYSGALGDNLADIAAARANTMTMGTAGIAENELARRMQMLNSATNFATGQQATGLGSIGGGGNLFATLSGQQGQMAAQESANSAQMWSSLGQAAGNIAGKAIGGKKAGG